MKKVTRYALLLAPLLLVACGKKAEEQPVAPVVVVAPAPAPAAAAPAAPVDPEKMSDEQRELARKQAKLDYGTMEDKYINDTRAQWATSANASSTYGDGASDVNKAINATGPIDDKEWTNKHEDIGFDWIELGYAKPVNATEVRLVVDNEPAIESLTKVELQDTDGKWHVIWSGISDVKEDQRGDRTWFVRSFDKTAYKAKAVKYTFANNVRSGHKDVEAGQLVGD